ncbi:MAG: NifU family protein [Acidimicrobiales bacterium]
MDDCDLHAAGDRIEALLEQLRSSTEGRVWMRVEELVCLLTEFYGAGMARTIDLLGDQPAIIARLARDDLVGSLLLLHDLHPEDLATRAARAVEAVAAKVREAGAEVELTAVDPGTAAVSVTVTSGGAGCGSTAKTLRETVTQALVDAVPDAVSLDIRVDTPAEPTPIRLGRKPARAGIGPSAR